VTLGSGCLFTGTNSILNSTFDGSISGSNGDVFKEGSNTVTLTGTSTYPRTHVNGGTLVANGFLLPSGYVDVNSGGTLSGHGAVGTVTVNPSGTIAPGDTSPGTLHTGDVVFGASSTTFAVRLNNPIYDQLQAGNVDLTQQPNLSPTLPLPPPAPGDSFTILTGTINGTFNNHPNNDIFLINGYAFQITYTASSVVLRRVPPAVSVGTSSLIQSDYYLNGSVHGRFDAVVNACGGDLVHYYNDNEGSGWHQGEQIVPDASGPGSIIQSDWTEISPLDPSGPLHGHWEVLVPRNNQIEHWYSNGGLSWKLASTFAPGATAASFIQSDYNQFGHRYMEAVVTQGTNLVHYVNQQDGTGWHQWETIVSGVSGQGSIIQSDWVSLSTRPGFTNELHRHFEVVVQVNNHIEHRWNEGGSTWNFDASFANNVADGPASIIQSDWITNGHGHYEVLVPQFGGQLVHYVNNSDGSPWYLSETVSPETSWPASIIQSDWITNGHGRYEALLAFSIPVELVHWVGQPWYSVEDLIWHCGAGNGNQPESGSGGSGMAVGKAPGHSRGVPSSSLGWYGPSDAAPSEQPRETPSVVREEASQTALPRLKSASQDLADIPPTPALELAFDRDKDHWHNDPLVDDLALALLS
jgi:hypothetical protein